MWKIVFLFLYLLILSVYDYKEKQVPLVLLYVGMAIVTCVSVIDLVKGTTTWVQLLGILPGIILILVAFVTGKAGVADGIVLSIAGAILGHRESWLLFTISLMLILVSSVFLLLLRKINMKARIPYLPFLTVALLLQQVW